MSGALNPGSQLGGLRPQPPAVPYILGPVGEHPGAMTVATGGCHLTKKESIQYPWRGTSIGESAEFHGRFQNYMAIFITSIKMHQVICALCGATDLKTCHCRWN